MRINKYISHNTKYSRREADELIRSGEVRNNKETISDLSYQVEDGDKISVKGRAIEKRKEVTVIIYNKPKGVLVTKKDGQRKSHNLP